MCPSASRVVSPECCYDHIYTEQIFAHLDVSHLARTIQESSFRNLPGCAPREAYLVIRAGLARRARKAGLAGSFIFVNRACRARLACLAHNLGTTSDEEHRSSGAAIAADVFMNNAG